MPSLVAAATLFCLSSGMVSARTPGNPRRSGATTGQAGTTSSAPALPAGKPRDASQSDPELTKAKSLFEGGKFSEAEAATRQFLKAHADSAEAHFLLGQILFQELHDRYAAEAEEGEAFTNTGTLTGELAKLRDAKARESITELSEGAKYGTPSAFDLKILAMDYVLLRDNSLAAKYLTLALKSEPKDPQGWFYLGRIFYSQDEFAGAIVAFENCLKLEPRNAVTEYNVGLSYEGLKQNEEAIQAYETAIEWQGQNGVKSSKAFTSLARIYLDENQPEKALPYLQQAVAAFPEVALAHEELGRVYSALNQLPEAQKELEKAVSLEPEAASVHLMLGQVYRKRGMADKAKSEFQKAQELYGTHASEKPGS
jgi:tetratricopeptide (TPR) repeat protein